MLDALLVFAVVWAVGVVALPLAELLFPRLPGRGLVLARPLGLVVLTFPVWLAASLLLAPYGRSATVVAVVAFVCVGEILRRRGLGRLPGRGAERTVWLVGEAVFAGGFALFALLRSFEPEIWQTEKPMDMALVNVVNRSESFPPHDPWQSGTDVNYYYYGHYLVAFVGRLTAIAPEVAYNLGLALFYGLTAAAVYGVAAILYTAASARGDAPRRPAALVGVTATAAAVILGNLAGGFQLLRDPGRLGTFDWWSPSRVIDGTANEFPAFSFLLGDLHAHVMATAFALVVVAYAIQLGVHGPPELGARPARVRAGAELVLAGLALGVLYPVNSLDYPTSCAIGCGALLLWALDAPGRGRRALAWGGAWIVTSVVLFLPFWHSFDPPTLGVGVVREHTPFSTFARDYLLIYGLSLWVVLAMLARRYRMPYRFVLWGGAGALFVLVLLAPSRLSGVTVALVLAAAAVYAAFSSGDATAPARVLWLLTAVALGLIAVGEVAYIRDAFAGTASFRFNTVFKAGYQAWALLAVVTGVGAFWSASWMARRVRRVWLGALAALVVLALVYPVLGSYSRLLRFQQSPTLDGMQWLERTAPGDAAAVRWLRASVPGSPAILEAVGRDFDPSGRGRISTFTGLPTVMGWAGHEVQWGHDPGTRAADVQRIYGTADVALARSLLRRYDVRYVVVGSLEREDYRPAALRKFDRLGRPVFRSGSTVVYRVDGSTR